MKIVEPALFSRGSRWRPAGLLTRLALALLVTAGGTQLAARQSPPAAAQEAPRPLQSASQLQQLVAPIALYPDSLVAEILAASTYPEQVVVAQRWMQAHPGLQGEALGRAVDQEPWDASIKALTAFPAVLGNLDKNLSWTSSLGDAYYNQQQEVMDAVQSMRVRARQSGSLKTTPQQTVAVDGPNIVIQPADANIVYVPAYDPWEVYGEGIAVWPGWYDYPGIYFHGPYLSFGLGFGIGFYGGMGWGWNHWGFDWHNRHAMFNHDPYHSGSRTFYNRTSFYQGGNRRGVTLGNNHSYTGHPGEGFGHPTAPARPFNGNAGAARGYGEGHGETGVRSGAFSGIQHGGQTRTFSSRGSSSFGGGARGGASFGGSRGGGRHR